MSAEDRLTYRLEALALHAALWGDPAYLLDAVDTESWHPALFVDDAHHRTAEAITALVGEGRVPYPLRVWDRLVESGDTGRLAMEMVLLPGAFADAGYRLDGLPHYLAKLAEGRMRRHFRQRLARFADTLERPGGPDRLAELLGEVIA